MFRKYILTDETCKYHGVELCRIRATQDIIYHGSFSVRAGEFGGWVESEKNLSQSGGCWIAKNAKVYGNARVQENAFVGGQSVVCDDAIVSGNASIHEKTIVCDKAKVYENASIGEDSTAIICDNAQVHGDAYVRDNSIISGWANVYGEAFIAAGALVSDNVHVYEHGEVNNGARAYGFNTQICGTARVCGDAVLDRSSKPRKICAGEFWSEADISRLEAELEQEQKIAGA